MLNKILIQWFWRYVTTKAQHKNFHKQSHISSVYVVFRLPNLVLLAWRRGSWYTVCFIQIFHTISATSLKRVFLPQANSTKLGSRKTTNTLLLYKDISLNLACSLFTKTKSYQTIYFNRLPKNCLVFQVFLITKNGMANAQLGGNNSLLLRVIFTPGTPNLPTVKCWKQK